MNSPFPGMDPYLEQHWRSVHHRLVTYAGDALQQALPAQFRVEVEERLLVAGGPDGTRSIVPDVYITKQSRAELTATSASAMAVAQPVVIRLADEPIREAYLEIIDTTSGNQVITAVEFLSPTNKTPGDGLDMYLRKQSEYRAAGVSTVEVDLTRQGRRELVLPVRLVPPNNSTTWLACVRCAWTPLEITAWPIGLLDQLPVIGVPLVKDQLPVPLDLQALIRQCYERGRYADTDYSKEPLPPLSPDDQELGRQLLKAHLEGGPVIIPSR